MTEYCNTNVSVDNYSFDHLGVRGFENFLFLILLCTSVIWWAWVYPISQHRLTPLDTKLPITGIHITGFNTTEINSIEINSTRLNRKSFNVQLQTSPSTLVQSTDDLFGQVIEPGASATYAKMNNSATLTPNTDFSNSEQPGPPKVESVPSSADLPVGQPSHINQRMPNTEQLVKQAVDIYFNENTKDVGLRNLDTTQKRTSEVFDPRLAATLAKSRVKQKSQDLATARAEAVATGYMDNNRVQHYRDGNNCLEVRNVYGFGERWFKTACTQTRDDIEFNIKIDK